MIPGAVSDEQFKYLMKILDVNGDGSIDFSEFEIFLAPADEKANAKYKEMLFSDRKRLAMMPEKQRKLEEKKQLDSDPFFAFKTCVFEWDTFNCLYHNRSLKVDLVQYFRALGYLPNSIYSVVRQSFQKHYRVKDNFFDSKLVELPRRISNGKGVYGNATKSRLVQDLLFMAELIMELQQGEIAQVLGHPMPHIDTLDSAKAGQNPQVVIEKSLCVNYGVATLHMLAKVGR